MAAFIFFTRLPFWKLAEVPGDYFKRIVSYWPLVGWFTAGTSVAVLLLSSLLFPPSVSVLLAIVTRLLVTGCLHEDGLADFLDGFGGGVTRDRVLQIMKDSHIGTYGVIGLLCYFLLYYHLLVELPLDIQAGLMLVADPLCKGIAGMIINCLPYVRKAEESKSHTVYDRMDRREYLICLFSALLPLFWLPSVAYCGAVLLPLLVFWQLIRLMKRRIGGYTGDCCGALFLLCEISFYLGAHIIYRVVTG